MVDENGWRAVWHFGGEKSPEIVVEAEVYNRREDKE